MSQRNVLRRRHPGGEYVCNDKVVSPSYYSHLKRAAKVYDLLLKMEDHDFVLWATSKNLPYESLVPFNELLEGLNVSDLVELDCEKALTNSSDNNSWAQDVEASLAQFGWRMLVHSTLLGVAECSVAVRLLCSV